MLIEEYYLDWEDDTGNHPGVKPQHSFLYFDDYFFCIEPEDGRRLGQAKVNWHFEADKEKWRERYGCIPDPKKNDEKKDGYKERQNKHKDFLERRKNRVERLNNVLVSLSASVMDTRIPVVSLGSYAVPSRLQHLYKTQNVSVNSFIPVFQADLVGFNYVYTTNITKKGGIRTVPVYSPGRKNDVKTRVQVMFMNKAQIEKLQANDKQDNVKPHYQLVKIDTMESDAGFQHVRLEICESNEILHYFYLYSCDEEPLVLDESKPEWLAPPSNVTEVKGSDLKEKEKKQDELLEELRPLWNGYVASLKSPEFPIPGYKECHAVKPLRKNLETEVPVSTAFKDFLRQEHTMKTTTFIALKLPHPAIEPSECSEHTYAEIKTSWKDPSKAGYHVKKTDGYFAGDFVIEAPQKGVSAYIKRMRYPYVLLKHSSVENVKNYSPYSIIGRLIASDTVQPEKDEWVNIFAFSFLYKNILLKNNWERIFDKYFPNSVMEQGASAQHKSSVDPEGINVNMTLRTAIGLEIGERLTYFIPNTWFVRRTFQSLQDRIIPRRYLITRLQRGEPAAIEIRACLLPAETLQMLGIEVGDYVWLEGIPHEKNQWKIPTLRLRAYPIPVDVIEQRATLVKNIEDALFPDCSESLGVFPDLDPIMLDEMARKQLNLEICSPVRIRASRRHQISKETRNFLLVFLISLIGALSVFTTDKETNSIDLGPVLFDIVPLWIVILVVLFVIGFGVILRGLHARLKP